MGYLITEMQRKLLKIYELAHSTDERKLRAAAEELFPGENIPVLVHTGCTRGFIGVDGELIKPTHSIICKQDAIAIFKDGTAHVC